MILFPFNGFEKFTEGISNPKILLGSFHIKQFKNGESRAYLDSIVIGEDCIIIGTIAPPADNFLDIAKLAEVIKSSGAKSVSLFAPYLAYTRHNNSKDSEGATFHLMCAMLKASGISRILTVDPHGSVSYGLSYGIPVTSLDAVSIISKEINNSNFDKGPVIMVSPDKGYAANAKVLSEAVGIPLLVLEKVRTDKGVTITPIEKAIPHHAIIVDDILDTGGTLIEAINVLKISGVTDFTIVVTHGLFTGDEWEKLFRMGVKRIITSDSVPRASIVFKIDPRIHLVSLVDLFQSILS